MKIWTIVINDDFSGFEPEIHFGRDSAEGAAEIWVITAWDRWLENPYPDVPWREAYDLLCQTVGFMDTIVLTEHDISGHPAASQARGALNNCAAEINQLADLTNLQEDAGVLDALLDVETALEMLK